MNNRDKLDFEKMYAYIDQRMDSLESLIKLVLINTIIDNVEEVTVKNEDISNEVIEYVQNMNYCVEKAEYEGDSILLYIKPNSKVGIREIRKCADSFRETWENVIPVFMLEKVSPMQKRKLLEEKMSFIVKGKEIHIMI